MNTEIFYVRPQSGTDKYGKAIFDKIQSIPVKFLMVNGVPVVDPNPNGSTKVNIYSRLSSTGYIDESSIFSNSHNYLIVPANYSPSEAVSFAAGVDIGMVSATALGGPEAGVAVGLAAMTTAFYRDMNRICNAESDGEYRKVKGHPRSEMGLPGIWAT